MIRVNRGPEPAELRRVRDKRLRAAVKAFNSHGPESPQLHAYLDGGYEVAKLRLFRQQHKKCAYCESYTPLDEAPTEHFRPKKRARRDWRDSEAIDEDNTRYWWLTWTWNNLLFSCTTCNGQSHKGNRFPLVAGTRPLPAPSRPVAHPLPDIHFDTTAEQPLLLDPADPSIDPLDHVRWRPLDPAMPPSMWKFGVRGISIYGRATVRILRLDRRADFIDATYRDVVWHRFRREILAKAKGSKRAAIEAAWLALVRDLVQPQAEYAAAKWCMLDALRTSSHALAQLRLPEVMRPIVAR